MTTFITPAHPTHHHGADRIESVIHAAQSMGKNFSGVAGLFTTLLSGFVAAILVLSSHLLHNVAAGHWVVIWMSLWTIGFFALAFFSGAAQHIALETKTGLDAWSRAQAQTHADRRFWAAAQADNRIMMELQAAKVHQEPAEPTMTASLQDMHNAKIPAFMASAHTREYI